MRAEKKELHPRSCFEKDRLAKKKNSPQLIMKFLVKLCQTWPKPKHAILTCTCTRELQTLVENRSFVFGFSLGLVLLQLYGQNCYVLLQLS
jgi:hypothetical protein